MDDAAQREAQRVELLLVDVSRDDIRSGKLPIERALTVLLRTAYMMGLEDGAALGSQHPDAAQRYINHWNAAIHRGDADALNARAHTVRDLAEAAR